MPTRIVPFFFIYSPAILLQVDSNLTIAWACVTGVIGTLLLAISIEGYLYMELPFALRTLFFVAALSLIQPGLLTDCVGFGLGILGLWIVLHLKKKDVGKALFAGD